MPLRQLEVSNSHAIVGITWHGLGPNMGLVNYCNILEPRILQLLIALIAIIAIIGGVTDLTIYCTYCNSIPTIAIIAILGGPAFCNYWRPNLAIN